MYEARWRWAHCRVSLQRRRWDECHLSRQRRFRDNCSGKRNWLTQRRRRDCQSLRSGHKKRMHPYRGSGRRGGDCETMSMNSIGATCKGGAMTINWGALSINWGTVTVSVRTTGGGTAAAGGGGAAVSAAPPTSPGTARAAFSACFLILLARSRAKIASATGTRSKSLKRRSTMGVGNPP